MENTFTLNITLLKEGYQNIVASRVHGNIAQLIVRIMKSMHDYYVDLFLFHLLSTETSMMVVLL